MPDISIINPVFVLAAINSKTDAYEVIAFTSAPAYDFFKAQLKRRPWMSLMTINRQDAIKLIKEHAGVGAGCFILGDSIAQSTLRAYEARTRMLRIAILIGAGVVEDPVPLIDLTIEIVAGIRQGDGKELVH